MMFFAEIEKCILIFLWILDSQSNLGKEDHHWRTHTFLIPKLPAVIPAVWYSHKDRHIDKWNRIRSSEINTCIYCQDILTRMLRPFTGENKTVFSTYDTRKIGYSYAKQ
jgi:hypothetical protein